MTTPEQNDARLAVVESKVADLANDNARIEALMVDGQRRLESKIDALTEKYAGRPTWLVATYLGAVSSTCVGLAVAIITTT